MSEDSPTLEQIQRQEEELVFESFDNDRAWALGQHLVAGARSRGHAVTVDIRRGGQQLFHAALPGTAPDNDAWVERKVRVVTRYGKSTLRVRREAEAGGKTFEQSSRLDPDAYAAHGGGFPITVRGTGVVGVVTVSGLPQLEDHAFVTEGLRAFLAEGR